MGRSVWEVRTQDSEKFVEEVKSLVTAHSSPSLYVYILFVWKGLEMAIFSFNIRIWDLAACQEAVNSRQEESRSPDLFLLFCGLLVDLQNRNFFLAHERFWQSRPLAPSIHYINKAKGLWNKNGHTSLASPTIHKIIEARARWRIVRLQRFIPSRFLWSTHLKRES